MFGRHCNRRSEELACLGFVTDQQVAEAFPPEDRSDGPYYIAPDSAKPLPSGIWEELDPILVEKTAEDINANRHAILGIDGRVKSEVRKLLFEDIGLLGKQLIMLLESGSAESADAFAEAVLAEEAQSTSVL